MNSIYTSFRAWKLHQKICLAFMAAYCMGYFALAELRPWDRDTFGVVLNTLQLTPHLVATLCAFLYVWRGKHSTPTRRLGWLFIAMAVFLYLLGDVLYAVYCGMYNGKVPYPSWSDAAFLAYFPVLIAGLLLQFNSLPIAGRIRLMLDSAIAASSLGVLSWYFVARQLWNSSGISTMAKLVNVLYPLGDIAVAFCAIVLLNSLSGNRGQRRSLRLVAGAIFLWSCADTIYIYYRFHKAFTLGNWYDWGWPVGALLVAYACLLPFWSRADYTDLEEKVSLKQRTAAAHSWWHLTTPYIAAGAALTTVFVDDYRDDHRISNGVLFIGVSVLILVMLRQVFTLWENRDLNTRLSAQLGRNQTLMSELQVMNDNLEQRVDQRTGQLSALLELTKAVNGTLKLQDVFAIAMEKTRQALRTESVIVWLLDDESTLPEPPVTCLHIGLDDCADTLSFLSTQTLLEEPELLPLPVLPLASARHFGVCLRVPLKWHDMLLGMIGVIRWNTQVDPTEWEMLQSIGLEVGTAIENAKLFHAALEAADKDPVTGLLNHRAVHHHLDRELEIARKQEDTLAVIMIDLNNFKLFNDTYGHPVGDQVLKSVAQMLRETCRDSDYTGRYGGDEFLLVLPGTELKGAYSLAERVRERMQFMGFRHQGDDRTVPVTLSFGIAVFPMDSANRHELLTIADSNLYTAKRSEDGIRATSEIQRANRQLRSEGSFESLDAMVTAVDNKDQYTRRHSEDVTEYALWIADELGVSEETLRLIRIGSLLHDVGKIGVPDEILRKPGRLTPEEYEIMKRHPRLGAMIVGAVPGMENVVDAVRAHHERWDGNGYPDATPGEETPFLGRLLAVADAFSAMTTDRPYRKGMDWNRAIQEIQANVGTQFDPTMAHAFLRAARKRRGHVTLPSDHTAEAAPLPLAA